MKNKTIKNYILFTSLFLLTILLLIVSLQKHENNSFNKDTTVTYNDGWMQEKAGEKANAIRIPGTVSYDLDHNIVLKKKLPAHIMSGLTICFWAQEQSVTAYISGEKIYSCGEKKSYVFGKDSGRYWNMIKIPESASGAEIVLKISTPYNEKQDYVDDIYIGTQSSILFTVLGQYGFGLLLSIFLLLIGVATAVIFLVYRKTIGPDVTERVLYLCFFCVLLAVWIFSQSRMAQYFTGNSFVIIGLYHMGGMLLPVPMLYYIAQEKENHMRKPIMLLAYIMVANFLCCTILQFANLYDFSQTWVVTLVLTSVAICMLFVNALLERFKYHNDTLQFLEIGIYLLTVFYIAEVVMDLKNQGKQHGNCIRFGAVCLVTALVFEAVNKAVKRIESSRNAEYYQRLATVDIMANCYSRTAYNNDIEALGKKSMKDLAVILFDLNYLKRINDTYGHIMGDRAIKTCSICLRKVFDKVGRVYRMGGDEFVVIVPKCDEYKLLQRIALFQRIVAEQNKHFEFEFNVACGYAVYDSKKDHTIDDLIRRADASMYERKRTMKQGQKELH